MTLAPDLIETFARARSDLRMGVPVLLRSGDGTQALAVAVETVSPDRFAQMGALGPLDLALTGQRAETLKARVYDGDIARVAVPGDVGLGWLQDVADPAQDLSRPMKGPLISRRDGSADAHRAAIALCKAARLLPAALVLPGTPDIDGLLVLDSDRVLESAQAAPALNSIVSASVPLQLAETARLHVFRPDDGADEHYAIEVGRPDRDAPVLARLHSACFTGDLLGSLKCDCGPQLRAALAQMGQGGSGVLLYLNQEGRGIGLANKMRAYALQDQGFDTVEANHRLGFEDDERDFRLGAQILQRLGFSAVRLLTNNPAKVAMLETCGLSVTERVPLRVGETPQNARYLAVKAEKSGHLL